MGTAFNANQSLQNAAGVLLPVYDQLFRQPNYPRHGKAQIEEEVTRLLDSQHEDIEAEFNQLVKDWKSAGRAKSLTYAIAMHPAYQRIIGLGTPAIPLILRELSRELDHWFWALEAISRKDPVPDESKGDLKEMTRIWMQWGREHGYAW